MSNLPGSENADGAENLAPVSAVAVGRPAQSPSASGRRRAGLGTTMLWYGAIALVLLRASYELAATALRWSEITHPWFLGTAWLILVVASVAVVISVWALGEQLPDSIFWLFIAAIAVVIAIDAAVNWDKPGLAGNLTVGIAAATAIILAATTRATWETIGTAAALTTALMLASLVNSGGWVLRTEDVFAISQLLAPAIVFTIVVDTFRNMVTDELDRTITQGVVTAPRLAVGMLASEELARLDLEAEELLTALADGTLPLPPPKEAAAQAGRLATDLRMHLLARQKQTWLHLALIESQRLGRTVRIEDPEALAGYLNSGQRDGLLSALWLLLPTKRRSNQRIVTVRLGPAGAPNDTSQNLVIPISISTAGARRSDADPAIWAELGRVGRHWDSVANGLLTIDIRATTTDAVAVR